jgi:predicted metal-dependent hydrolase
MSRKKMSELLEKLREFKNQEEKEVSFFDVLLFIGEDYLKVINKNGRLNDEEIIKIDIIQESLSELYAKLKLMQFIDNTIKEEELKGEK